MITETKIRCFLGLAETGSFTQTASLLFLTQQGVSKHIANLEEDVGCRLLVRQRRSIALTRDGERLREIFQSFITAYDSFCDDTAPETAKLRLGYLVGMDFGEAPIRALDQLKARHGVMDVQSYRCPPDDLVTMLQNGALDIIFTCARFRPRQGFSDRLTIRQIRLDLMVSKTNPLATQSATYRDFADYPLISDAFASESASEAVQRAQEDARSMELNPVQIITVPNRESVFLSAENGIGICISPENSSINRTEHLMAYPLPVKDDVCCFWDSKRNNKLASSYISTLRKLVRPMAD